MAKVVDPQNGTHTIRLIPRFDNPSALQLFLKSESTQEESEVAIVTTGEKNGMQAMTFDFSFSERDKYQIRIMDGAEVYYRGLLFATSQPAQSFKITEGFLTY